MRRVSMGASCSSALRRSSASSRSLLRSLIIATRMMLPRRTMPPAGESPRRGVATGDVPLADGAVCLRRGVCGGVGEGCGRGAGNVRFADPLVRGGGGG